jgi:antitoxin component of MazEF toxin-antitoxin module
MPNEEKIVNIQRIGCSKGIIVPSYWLHYWGCKQVKIEIGDQILVTPIIEKPENKTKLCTAPSVQPEADTESKSEVTSR